MNELPYILSDRVVALEKEVARIQDLIKGAVNEWRAGRVGSRIEHAEDLFTRLLKGADPPARPVSRLNWDRPEHWHVMGGDPR